MNLICVEEEEGAGAGTGVAEDAAVTIDDVEEVVVDGAGTRLGITGSGFTATLNRGRSWRRWRSCIQDVAGNYKVVKGSLEACRHRD